MKGAAKCDNRCELQNSVNQWPLERALRSWDMPESMSASVPCVLLLSPFESSAAACYCAAALACSISSFAHWFD